MIEKELRSSPLLTHPEKAVIREEIERSGQKAKNDAEEILEAFAGDDKK